MLCLSDHQTMAFTDQSTIPKATFIEIGVYGTKKSKEWREKPMGTMSYQTSSKRSPPFWLLIGARKLVFFWHQSEARTAATVGTGLVRHCPQGLFSPFFTFLRATFFRPFRLSLVPTICPWVSEDGSSEAREDKRDKYLKRNNFNRQNTTFHRDSN